MTRLVAPRKETAITVPVSGPATPFVAEFVGLTNRLPGNVRDGQVEVRGVRLPLVKSDTPANSIAERAPRCSMPRAWIDASAGWMHGTASQ